VISLSGTGLAENNKYQIANEEFASFPMYYWGNAKSFSGNRVLSYGLSISFHVSWVHARGDTSGKPITDYDLIIQVFLAIKLLYLIVKIRFILHSILAS